MNLRNNRGAVAVAAYLLWVGVAAVAAFAFHEYRVLTAPSRDKKAVDNAAASSVQTAQQAGVVLITAKDLQKAVDDAVTAAKASDTNHQAVEANAAGFSYGANTVLLAEPNPSPRVQLATKLTDSAFKALGSKLPPEQKAIWDALLAAREDDKAAIAARDAKIADMTVAAGVVAGTLEATTARAAQAETTVKTQATTIVTQATDLKTEAVKSATLTGQVKAWADKEPGFLAKIKALGALLALAVIGLVWYEIHRRGITGSLKDAVALKESLKSDLIAVTKDAPAVEAKIAAWWGDAKADEAKVAAVTQDLRL